MAKKIGIPARQPTRKPGVERYNRIIAAAEYLILEAGSLETITLDAVAKQAGVPRASLYYFFASIESLLEALYPTAWAKSGASLYRLRRARHPDTHPPNQQPFL
jgi:AcrR family transcriptional regulator